MALLKKRLFVGNVPLKSSQSDVKKKLSRFGNVQSVEMKQRSDSEGNVLSSFAFVDIETNASDLANCFQYFKNELWHSQQVNVQVAKESFLDRLKREQKSAKNASESVATTLGNYLTINIKHGGVANLRASPEPNGNRKTFSSSKDETSLNKKTSPRERVRLRSLKRSSILVDDTVCEREEIENNGVEEEEVSKGKGLPMFGGTKLIGLEDAVVSDYPCGVQTRKLRNVTGMGSPNNDNVYSLSRTVRRNSFEVPGDDSNGDTKVPKRNKNLPMFCGSIAIIEPEKCVKYKDFKANTRRDGDKGSDENLMYPMKGDDASGCEALSKYLEVQDSSSEVKAEGKKKVKRNVTVSPTRINENKSPGRNNVEAKNYLMAEQKRLNALEERKKAFALQKEAVKKALSSVDSKIHCNKKIIFDEDDDDQAPESLDKEKDALSDEPKHKLFEDNSDDEDIKNLESVEFKIKPQFEGRKGQKLLEIQSRYGHDCRFNLDERFLESDEEDSGKEEPSPTEDDLNAEKDHQLHILKEMLGVDVSSRKPKRDKVDQRDSFQMVRFDPSNPEHSKYVVKEGDLESAAEKEGRKGGRKKGGEAAEGGCGVPKRAKGDGGAEEEEPVPVVMDRFYKVSEKLKESLRKWRASSGSQEGGDWKPEGTSGGFSLLQKYGSPLSDNEEEEVEYSTKAITRNRNEWEKNPFRYDSSEEEDEVETTKPSEGAEASEEKSSKSNGVTSEQEQSHISKVVTETFYFQENDARLQEGLDFFEIKKTFAEMQEGFHERRADLKLIVKAKVRNNKRRNRPLKKNLGGARKHKKNMAKFGVKR